MGTRLYIEFNTPEDEAAFFHTTVESVRNAREEYKRWMSKEVHQQDDSWYDWYNSLSKLAREINDNELFGLGKLQFDASEIVPGTYSYGGFTNDKYLMRRLLEDHSATCCCDDGPVERAIFWFNGIKSVSWG